MRRASVEVQFADGTRVRMTLEVRAGSRLVGTRRALVGAQALLHGLPYLASLSHPTAPQELPVAAGGQAAPGGGGAPVAVAAAAAASAGAAVQPAAAAAVPAADSGLLLGDGTSAQHGDGGGSDQPQPTDHSAGSGDGSEADEEEGTSGGSTSHGNSEDDEEMTEAADSSGSEPEDAAPLLPPPQQQQEGPRRAPWFHQAFRNIENQPGLEPPAGYRLVPAEHAEQLDQAVLDRLHECARVRGPRVPRSAPPVHIYAEWDHVSGPDTAYAWFLPRYCLAVAAYEPDPAGRAAGGARLQRADIASRFVRGAGHKSRPWYEVLKLAQPAGGFLADDLLSSYLADTYPAAYGTLAA